MQVHLADESQMGRSVRRIFGELMKTDDVDLGNR
ncbi:hypothetical protein Smp_098240 [Schistosoma mansoni]|nr:hypothetical protein Smp_098240 [Schistosoma mansoni]|eukprot:XP_018647325.1 hypothetical protein Smp_098240 [Schistosoma mansoni]